eukprot:7385905-Prymnesium_polylepis.3
MSKGCAVMKRCGSPTGQPDNSTPRNNLIVSRSSQGGRVASRGRESLQRTHITSKQFGLEAWLARLCRLLRDAQHARLAARDADGLDYADGRVLKGVRVEPPAPAPPLTCVQCAICKGWRVTKDTSTQWTCRLSPTVLSAHACSCAGAMRSYVEERHATEPADDAGDTLAAAPQPAPSPPVRQAPVPCTQCLKCQLWRPCAPGVPLDELGAWYCFLSLDATGSQLPRANVRLSRSAAATRSCKATCRGQTCFSRTRPPSAAIALPSRGSNVPVCNPLALRDVAGPAHPRMASTMTAC